jgi:hypothetical protein
MLGKSAGTAASGLCALIALSCAHNVAQDAHTGEDGKTKGAKAITLDNGEGKASGIVTYPGGDRVDWKMIELPPKTRGQLDIELKWTPPRPGLQLAFDVFDEWNNPIVTSKKTGKGKRTRSRTASVEKGPGNTKYFIRVYAMNRGDAGKYKMTLEWHETGDSAIDWAKVDVQDPPKLAAVPVEIEPCDDTNFDQKKPECRNFCPTQNPPPGWKACVGHCPDPPDPANKACWDKVCPAPPTTESKACMANPKKYFPPCADVNNPDPDNPNCPKNRPPVTTRVMEVSVSGSDSVITISAGNDKGVKEDWRGTLLKGNEGDTPLDGGEITIVRCGKLQCIGKVHLTPDQVNRNLRVKLIPPGK